MSRIHILGIGSPSGGDQAGWLTVDALLASGLGMDGDVVIEKLDRPGANLIPLLGNAGWVILIDAMQSHRQAGQIQRFDQQDWPNYCHGLSSHGLGVIDTLALARELGCLPTRLDLYGIEIGDAMPGEMPGICIQAAALQLAALIKNALSRSPV